MGLLGTINDVIWKHILSAYSIITDNVYFVILMTSVVFGIIMVIFKVYLYNKFDWKVDTFGPISLLFTLSVGYMVERIPMIHERMNLALGTVSDIIQSSDTYSSAFEAASHIDAYKSVDIASYLYNLPEAARESWACGPKMLYDSLFRTFDDIRGGWILPDVHQSSTGIVGIGIMVLVIVLITCIVLLATKKESDHKLPFLNSSFIMNDFLMICFALLNNGAVMCAIILWIFDKVCVCFLTSGNTESKSRNNIE